MTMKLDVRVVLTTVISCCMMTSATHLWAQDEQVTGLEKRGRGALEKGDYQEAIELFSAGSAQATTPDQKARLDFRQAVTLQQMSARETNRDTRTELLTRAAGLYQGFIKLNPDSTAAANNLGKIYEQLGLAAKESGDEARANGYFKRSAKQYQRAISADDSRQGLYLKNYAQLLDHAGNWSRAKTIYSQIVKEQPMSPALQQSMAETYSAHGLDQLAQYLWELLEAGYTQQATDSALGALQASSGKSGMDRVELLTIVSAALAEEIYHPRAFLESGTGIRITDLVNDNFLGKGAAGIIRLHLGLPLDGTDYRWWARRNPGDGDPQHGLWPADGFRALARSLGSRAKLSGDFKLAEAYFRLAAELQGWDIDPSAVRALVQMYAERNEFNKIDTLLDEYQVGLFIGKGAAISSARDNKIFAYHQTLGELYALIGRWGSSSRVDSAIFQLEHAQEKSIEIENNSDGALPEKYQFTPQLVDMLATGYDRTGEASKGTKLRIEQAERYQKAGDSRATLRVLSPVKEAQVPESLKTRYETLIITPAVQSATRSSELRRVPNLEREQN